MNISKLTLIILFLFHRVILNTSIENDDFKILNIDITYHENNSTVPIQSDSSDQNDLTENRSQNKAHLYVIDEPLHIDSSSELTSTSLSNVFRLNQNGFSLFFNISSNGQKLAIAKRIKSEYGVNVSTSQIITFKLDELKCTTKIYCDNMPVEIQGKTDSLDGYPIEVKFNANKSTRACLQQFLFRIQIVKCEYTKYLKRSLHSDYVSSSRFDHTDLVRLLFGNDNEIFMTRQQLTGLANEICLDFCCQDSIPKQSIINLDDFIHENNIEVKQLEFEDAFNSLSSYMQKMKQNSVEIKFMYENIFIVKVTKWKRFIGINDSITAKINESLLSSFEICLDFVRANEEIWTESKKSLDKQLEELNWHSGRNVEWKILGDKVLPKSLNLTKLVKTTFQTGLRFRFFEKLVGDYVAAIEFTDGKTFLLNFFKILKVFFFFKTRI